MGTLIIKTVQFVDLCRLVVSPQEEEVFGVLDLVAEEEDDGLDGLLAPVDIVPQKQIVLVGRVTSIVEYFQQVLKLSVDISYNFDWGFQFQQHGLWQKDLSDSHADSFDLGFKQLDIIAFLLADEPVDEFVDFEGSYPWAVHGLIVISGIAV